MSLLLQKFPVLAETPSVKPDTTTTDEDIHTLKAAEQWMRGMQAVKAAGRSVGIYFKLIAPRWQYNKLLKFFKGVSHLKQNSSENVFSCIGYLKVLILGKG